jgi:hypothetical protein
MGGERMGRIKQKRVKENFTLDQYIDGVVRAIEKSAYLITSRTQE